jgi:hypothetical protein
MNEIAGVLNSLHSVEGFDGEDPVFKRAGAFQIHRVDPDTLVRKFMYLLEEADHKSWRSETGEELLSWATTFEVLLDIFDESDCSECSDDFRLGMGYDYCSLAALYVRTVLILVETIYGKDGWLTKKKPGYGLFLEREAMMKAEKAPESVARAKAVVPPETLKQAGGGGRESTIAVAPLTSRLDKGEIFERESNKAIVLLFKTCAQMEPMVHVFEGLDNEDFLEVTRSVYWSCLSGLLCQRATRGGGSKRVVAGGR